MGTPRRAVLKRVCRSCFEPRRSRDPVGRLFVQKPTANGGRAFWRPPTGPRDATETPARLHHILIQGNLYRMLCRAWKGQSDSWRLQYVVAR